MHLGLHFVVSAQLYQWSILFIYIFADFNTKLFFFYSLVLFKIFVLG
jgi:hypothetical protein